MITILQWGGWGGLIGLVWFGYDYRFMIWGPFLRLARGGRGSQVSFYLWIYNNNNNKNNDMKCCIYTRISALFELNMYFCGKCILSQFTCNFCIFRGVWPNDYRLHRGGHAKWLQYYIHAKWFQYYIGGSVKFKESQRFMVVDVESKNMIIVKWSIIRTFPLTSWSSQIIHQLVDRTPPTGNGAIGRC